MANVTGGPTEPIWLNKGDNAWQLTAATFVGLQSLPGLVVLYAGEFRKSRSISHSFSYRIRYRQDQMGHQFGLHGLLCFCRNPGGLGRMGVPDVLWQTNDPGPGWIT